MEVSVLGLGTMTFGEQTSREEAFMQMDLARDAGVNLLDTAEMYPVPPCEATQGTTESMIGDWLHARGCRDEWIVATKVTAPGHGLRHIREGNLSLTLTNLRRALEGSLKRLKTDRVDLYQIHWPERQTTNFGRRAFQPDGNVEEMEITPIGETLQALETLRQEGKIRQLGLCNDTPWGVMTAQSLAESQGWQPPVSIQNPYHLLNRSFEEGLAEVCHHEGIPLIAYSPLAFGKLTGKYLRGARPTEARLVRFPRFNRYDKPSVGPALQAYAKLAKQAGLTLTQLSLGFVRQQPLVGSLLLGARTVDQLRENLQAGLTSLSEDCLHQLNKIQERYPNPCP